MSKASRLNETELARKVPPSASWHADYRDTSWIYMGNLPKELSEGDVICLASQFGEVEDVDLRRHRETGEPSGFAFVKYEDHRSAILAVDNFDGATVCGRTLKVDHSKYDSKDVGKGKLASGAITFEELLRVARPGGRQDADLENEYTLENGVNLFSSTKSNNSASSRVADKKEVEPSLRRTESSSRAPREEEDRSRREESRSSRRPSSSSSSRRRRSRSRNRKPTRVPSEEREARDSRRRRRSR